MDSAPHIQVLLSTFNGEKYLHAQLNSLLSQTYRNFSISIRDDGSSDATVSILREFAKANLNAKLEEGENVGVVKSFYRLLESAEGDLFCFCDQDDVWLPEKLSRAVAALSESPDSSRTLYCSRLIFTDSDGHVVFTSKAPKHIGLRNAVVENIATGCTVVIGKQLRALALKARPEDVHMHDWWFYLLASTFGFVVFDATPTVYYRRHDATVTSLGRSRRTLFTRLSGFGHFMRGKRRLYGLRQAAKFYQTYSDIIGPKERMVFRYVAQLPESRSVIARIRNAARCPLLFNDFWDGLAIRLIVLRGHF